MILKLKAPNQSQEVSPVSYFPPLVDNKWQALGVIHTLSFNYFYVCEETFN